MDLFCTSRFTMLCKASPLIRPPKRPAKGSPQSAIVASSRFRARRLRSLPVAPDASRVAITLPALLPTTISGLMPCASRALITPTWAKPRAAPAPRTKPTTGFLLLMRLQELRLMPPRRVPMPIPRLPRPPRLKSLRRSMESGAFGVHRGGLVEFFSMWLLY